MPTVYAELTNLKANNKSKMQCESIEMNVTSKLDKLNAFEHMWYKFNGLRTQNYGIAILGHVQRHLAGKSLTILKKV
jgi:hypothetical protein